MSDDNFFGLKKMNENHKKGLEKSRVHAYKIQRWVNDTNKLKYILWIGLLTLGYFAGQGAVVCP